MNKIKISLYIIFFFIIILSFSKYTYSNENNIIFKINNVVFTSIDFQERKKYLEFIGSNEDITNKIILDDYISAAIFFEYYKYNNNSNINYDDILAIYSNIEKENKKNNKTFNYKINKSNILENLKLDLARKSILQMILNDKKDELKISKMENELLYKFQIEYLNIESDNIDVLIEKIENQNLTEISDIKNFLEDNNVNYFYKKNEITDINLVNEKIKSKINERNIIKIKDKPNKISLIKINKKFETFDSLIVSLFTYETDNLLEKDFLNCNYLNNLNDNKLVKKDYEFIKLNKELKNKLLNIGDFAKLNNNNKNLYVILCDIKFDNKILENLSLNKLINTNVKLIEKNFINKYSKIFNLEIYNE